MPTKKKISKADKIEAENLIEEASAIFESCIKCGMCKSICPTFKVLKEERISARGMGILFSDKVLEKLVFECNMCKGCEQKCPVKIPICEAVLKARQALVLKGKELKQNQEMIENVRKTGNPFGNNKDKDPEKLYCC